MFKKILVVVTILLFSVLILSGCGKQNNNTNDLDSAMYPEPIKIGSRATEAGGKTVKKVNQEHLSHLVVSGNVNYQDTQSMLNLINTFRKEKGISTLNMNQELMDAAQIRVSETAFCYSHVRPDHSAPSTINENIEAEIIGVGDDFSTVFKKWCQIDGNLKLLFNNNFKSIGIANYGNQGTKTFWVLLFSSQELETCQLKTGSQTIFDEIHYDNNYCPVEFVLCQENSDKSWEDTTEIKLNQQVRLKAIISPYLPNIKETETGLGTTIIEPGQLKWLTANSNIATVSSDGIVTSRSDGKTVIDAVFGEYIAAKQIYSGDESALGKIETGSAPKFITSKFNVYGHRGFSAKYPENSLISFVKAAECSAFDGMENDVHTTKDGQFIIMHDDNLMRTTGNDALISKITYDQARKATIKGGDGYTDEYKENLLIPSLTEYLDICYAYQKIAMIELKNFAQYEKDIPAMVAYISDYKDGWFKTHTLFISFNTDYLNAVANCTTIYPLEIMPGGKNITVAQANELFNKVTKGRQEDYTVIFRPSVGQLYSSGVEQFKKKNILLDCWGLKTGDKNTFNQLQKDGVLGITLDSPEGLGLDMSVKAPINE